MFAFFHSNYVLLRPKFYIIGLSGMIANDTKNKIKTVFVMLVLFRLHINTELKIKTYIYKWIDKIK